jgi:hypothetical protein
MFREKTMFGRAGAVGLLWLCACAAQAAVTTYEWTIDWQQRPDQSGTLSFDDGGDPTARLLVWDLGLGVAPPASLTGLPPGLAASGGLSFDGSFIVGLTGCDDAISACTLPATRLGFTQVSFALSAPGGQAQSYLFSPPANDPGSPCLQGDLLAPMPDRCFAIDKGVTTLTLTSAIPEPGTLALLLAGLAGLGSVARRRRDG